MAVGPSVGNILMQQGNTNVPLYYVESTWTISVTLVGGTGNTVPQYYTKSARYTRIGNLCFCRILLDGDGGDEGAGSGQLHISLPITVSTSQKADYTIAGHFHNGATENISFVQPVAGDTVAAVFVQTSISQTAAATGADQNNTIRAMSFDFYYEV